MALRPGNIRTCSNILNTIFRRNYTPPEAMAQMVEKMSITDENPTPPTKFVKYNWKDPLNLDSCLSEEEIMVRDQVGNKEPSQKLPWPNLTVGFRWIQSYLVRFGQTPLDSVGFGGQTQSDLVDSIRLGRIGLGSYLTMPDKPSWIVRLKWTGFDWVCSGMVRLVRKLLKVTDLVGHGSERHVWVGATNAFPCLTDSSLLESVICLLMF